MVGTRPLYRCKSEPQIAVDTLGSKLGDDVIISGDGGAASEIMNVKKTPVRWIVIGQPDDRVER